ncbi:hypothetical protein SLE2022_315840 [Rubroshorea leprosula]
MKFPVKRDFPPGLGRNSGSEPMVDSNRMDEFQPGVVGRESEDDSAVSKVSRNASRMWSKFPVKRDFPPGLVRNSCLERMEVSNRMDKENEIRFINGYQGEGILNPCPRILKEFPVRRDFPCPGGRSSGPVMGNTSTNDQSADEHQRGGVVSSPRILKEFPVNRDFPVGLGGRDSCLVSTNNSPNAKLFAYDKPLDGCVLGEFYDCSNARETSLPLVGNGEEPLSRISREFPLKQDSPLNGVEHFLSKNASNKDCNVDHVKVRQAISLFRGLFSKLSFEQKAKFRGSSFPIKVAMVMQKQKQWVNIGKRLGIVPGVEVGDEFQWRAELCVVGLHYNFVHGISYIKKNGKILATSVVDSWRYVNEVNGVNSFDDVIYTGQGNNPHISKTEVEDQTLVQGNLALKNSMDARTPIRVIRKYKQKPFRTNSKSYYNRNYQFIYIGLFMVEDYWQERGEFGKLVFKFLLKRILGQQSLSWWTSDNKE